MTRRNVPSTAQVRGWKITPPASPRQPSPEAVQSEPMHGYTLTDLDHLTRLVLRMDRWHQAADIGDRYDAVWHGLVEYILTADAPPGRGELLTAGTDASDAYVRDEMRTHGRDTSKPGPMPRFYAYWNPANPASPENGIVEDIAVAQIWARLTPSEQRALTALATTGDYESAAQIYGAAKGTFSSVVSTGRRRFFELWHEGETPSRQWRTDRRVSSRNGMDYLGRKRLDERAVDGYRARRHAGELLKDLAAEAGLSPTGLSRLINGHSKPAGEAA